MEYEHYTEVPTAEWRWPSFSPREIACKGTGKLLVNEQALNKLQLLRDRLHAPIILRSAYRSPEHNRKVGGAKNSRHMQGDAFDVQMNNHDPHEFEAAARAVGFTGFGYYIKSGFMHIDTGPSRSWGTPWPMTATTWPEERKPQPENLQQDKEAQAVAGAGVAGAVAVALDNLPAASGLIGQLAPTAQLVAVILAALFLAYVIYRRAK